MAYQVKYGSAERFKSVYLADPDCAEQFFGRVRRFAQIHGLPWTVALWKDGWLVKSERINEKSPV